MIVGVAGVGLTVTIVATEVLVQPDAFETVTENDPVLVTMIDCVVAPLDHKYPVEFGADNVTVLPAQIVVEPLALIVGTAGIGLTVTVVPVEEAD